MAGKVTVVVGAQWGDEGKGKIVDLLAPDYNVIARFNGGPNAGHTIEYGNNKWVLHCIPSGIFHEGKVNIMGNGTVINPNMLYDELQALEKAEIDISRFYISQNAHAILPMHTEWEKHKGTTGKLDTTLKGIGPAYMTKAARIGIRFGDFYRPTHELKDLIGNASGELGLDVDSGEIADEQKRLFEKYGVHVRDTVLLMNDYLGVMRQRILSH